MPTQITVYTIPVVVEKENFTTRIKNNTLGLVYGDDYINILTLNEQIQSDLQDDITSNTALISQEANLRTDGDSAVATLVTELDARTVQGDNTLQANIENEALVRTNADTVLAQQTSTVSARVDATEVSIVDTAIVVAGQFKEWDGVETPLVGMIRFGNKDGLYPEVQYQYIGGILGEVDDEGWVRTDRASKLDTEIIEGWMASRASLVVDPDTGEVTGWQYMDTAGPGNSEFTIQADRINLVGSTIIDGTIRDALFDDTPNYTVGFQLKSNAAGTGVDPSIFGAYILGSTLSTSGSGKRIEISKDTNELRAYGSDGNVYAAIGTYDDGTNSGALYVKGDSGNVATFISEIGDDNDIVFISAHGNGTGISVFAKEGTGGCMNLQSTDSIAAKVTTHGVNDPGIYALHTTSYVYENTTGATIKTNAISGKNSAVAGLKAVDAYCLSLYSTLTDSRAVEASCPAGSGNWDFYAAGGAANYGPFTGAHEGLVLKGNGIEVGDIVIDICNLYKLGVSTTINELGTPLVSNDKTVVGVLVSKGTLSNNSFVSGLSEVTSLEERKHLVDTYDYIQFNALGEGCVNVCGENGDIEVGDLITSSNMAGKGMKQDDDIIRSCTVGKSRETVTFDTPDQVKQIACVYYCG